ncbi:S1 family peptidase [Streptomyces sp. NPDC048290]|uniref:S1 family peptidase n=1 Tax=Streptomyces sp. NPDC048290 TaxID=3155811 RepID=UPI003443C244
MLLPNANASQDRASATAAPRTLKAQDASALATRLAESLGEGFAGSYYDTEKRQLVVNVTGDDARLVEQVQKAGAAVHEVDNSSAELAVATAALKRDATIPGTAWSIDPHTNTVAVTADSTVTGERWSRLEAAVKELGPGMATVKKMSGTFKPTLSGGDGITAEGKTLCSAGFNVTAGDGTPAFLTAGHCGPEGTQWSDPTDGTPIGSTVRSVFSETGDYALVKYTAPDVRAPSEVDLGPDGRLPISRAADALVGELVLRMGVTSGLASGRVTGLDATVNFKEGTVTGLIQTSVCAESGDSGGPLFTRHGVALGLTSGGNGDCETGGESFYEPVTTALDDLGAELGAGLGGAVGAGSGLTPRS